MKRGRSDTLTGGTGDVNPQWLSPQQFVLAAGQSFGVTAFALPVNRFATPKNKSIIIEVLKVIADYPTPNVIPAATGTTQLARYQISTKPLTTYDPSQPTVFAFGAQTWRGAMTATGGSQAVVQEPSQLDTTDGAGHGILVATDQIYFQFETVAYAAGTSVNFVIKIMYRFKEVSLQEYIGIVQSQQ